MLEPFVADALNKVAEGSHVAFATIRKGDGLGGADRPCTPTSATPDRARP